MGEYVRDILLVQNYFETIFPRAPEPILRQWKQQLEEMVRNLSNSSNLCPIGGVHFFHNTIFLIFHLFVYVVCLF